MSDRLLTVNQAADRLGLQPSTIRAWLASRRLVYVKCGGAVRIPASAVEQFIVDHTVVQQRAEPRAAATT